MRIDFNKIQSRQQPWNSQREKTLEHARLLHSVRAVPPPKNRSFSNIKWSTVSALYSPGRWLCMWRSFSHAWSPAFDLWTPHGIKRDRLASCPVTSTCTHHSTDTKPTLTTKTPGQWWYTLLIPAFRRQKASLVYKVSFRTARTTQRKCILKNQTNKNKKTWGANETGT